MRFLGLALLGVALSGCGRTYIDREVSRCWPNCVTLPPPVIIGSTSLLQPEVLAATNDGSLSLFSSLPATADGTPATITVDGSEYASPAAATNVVFVTRAPSGVSNARVYGGPGALVELRDVAAVGTSTYACGDLRGNITVGDTTINGGAGLEQPLVMVHTATGDLVTTYSLPAQAVNAQCGGIDVRDNVLMMTGIFGGELTVDGDTMTAQIDPNGFDAAFDATAFAPKWHRGLLSTTQVFGRDVALATDGAAYTAGTFAGAVDFAPPSLPASGGVDAYLFRYNSQGTLAWSRIIAGSGDEQVDALVSDPDGGVFICGATSSTTIAIADTTASASGDDVYIARISSSGAVAWNHTAAIGTSAQCRSLAVAADGTVYVAGIFGDRADFGGGTVTRDGTAGFVVAYDPNGALLGVVALETGSTVDALAIASDGQLWAAGTFTQHVTLNGTGYASDAASSLFLAPIDLQ